MKMFRHGVLALALGLSLTAALSFPPASSSPDGTRTHVLLAGSTDLSVWSGEWSDEVARRYPDALIVLTHGDMIGDRWFAFPDIGRPIPMEEMIENLRARSDPRQRIVLLSCNPGEYVLDSPGVTYAPNNVWITPNKNLPISSRLMRRASNPKNVGTIFDFTENPMFPQQEKPQ